MACFYWQVRCSILEFTERCYLNFGNVGFSMIGVDGLMLSRLRKVYVYNFANANAAGKMKLERPFKQMDNEQGQPICTECHTLLIDQEIRRGLTICEDCMADRD